MPTSKFPTFILKILVSAGLIAYFITKIDMTVLLEAISRAKLGWLVVGMLMYPFAQTVCTIRWQHIALALGIRKDLRSMVSLYFIGMFFNLFLPTSIGGDIARGLYLTSDPGQKRTSFLSVIVERGTGVLSMLILASATMLSPYGATLPPWLRFGFPLLSVCFFAFLWILPLIFQNTRTRVRQLISQDLDILWKEPRVVVIGICWSMLFDTIAVVIHACIARALSLDIPLPYHFITLSLASLSSMLPSFNGIGVRDGVYIYLLSLAGVSSTHGLLFSFLWFLTMAASSSIGCIVYLVRGLSPTHPAPAANSTGQ